MLKWGNSDVKNVMLGNTQVKKVYYGNALVWSARKKPTIKGSTVAAAQTVALPAHQPGDLILLFAGKSGGSPVISAPMPVGQVPLWYSLTDGTSANSYFRSSYFVATASNHTSGTWTNAQKLLAVVISGQRAASPIGAFAQTPTADIISTMTSPSLSLQDTSGSSLVLNVFYGFHTASWGWGTTDPGTVTDVYRDGPDVGHKFLAVSRNSTNSVPSLEVQVVSSVTNRAAMSVEVIAL